MCRFFGARPPLEHLKAHVDKGAIKCERVGARDLLAGASQRIDGGGNATVEKAAGDGPGQIVGRAGDGAPVAQADAV